MLALELSGLGQFRWLRRLFETFIDCAQDFLGFGWFSEDMLYATGTSQPVNFRDIIIGSVENDGNAHQQRLSPQAAYQRKPIHIWHEDVRNDQIRELNACHLQGLGAVTRFQQAIAKVPQQRGINSTV